MIPPNSGLEFQPGSGDVLIVDDEPGLRHALRRLLVAAGHSVVEAGTGEAARAALKQQSPGVVVLDLHLPDESGLDVLSEIRASGAPIEVVVLTGSEAGADMREALSRGATAYLRKPVDPLTLEAQVSLALGRARVQALETPRVREADVGATPEGISALLEELPFRLAGQLSHAWDLRHVETGAHVRRIAESTRRLALALGRPADESARLGRAAMLHDIGKIAIPDAILAKPGRLTEEELAIMRRHAELGSKLLSGTNHPFLELAAKVARAHHERWDGSGYPDGLIGTACLWEARLVGVVDVYDALGHMRSYKEAWPRERLSDFFLKERGKQFDPEIIDALLALMPDLESVKSDFPDPLLAEQESTTRLRVAPELARSLPLARR